MPEWTVEQVRHGAENIKNKRGWLLKDQLANLSRPEHAVVLRQISEYLCYHRVDGWSWTQNAGLDGRQEIVQMCGETIYSVTFDDDRMLAKDSFWACNVEQKSQLASADVVLKPMVGAIYNQ